MRNAVEKFKRVAGVGKCRTNSELCSDVLYCLMWLGAGSTAKRSHIIVAQATLRYIIFWYPYSQLKVPVVGGKAPAQACSDVINRHLHHHFATCLFPQRIALLIPHDRIESRLVYPCP